MKHFIQERLMSMVAAYILGLIIIIPFYLTFENQTPDEWWVDIKSIEAVSYENKVGEPLIFNAIIDIKRETPQLEWRHSLWCRPFDTYVPMQHWSTYTGILYGTEKRVINTDWNYLVNNHFDDGGQPSFPAECELRASISIQTPFVKQQKIDKFISKRFILK